MITAPVVLTAYVCWWLVKSIDRLLDVGIPGVGILVTLTGITLIGALASSFIARGALSELERLLERLPFVRLVYTWTKDLLNAFVGERKRFNRPVRIRLDERVDIWYLGFVTSDSLDHLGMPEHVAVYLPWSYSFAGRVILVPGKLVEPIAADSTEMLAFIVSGGLAGTADGTPRK